MSKDKKTALLDVCDTVVNLRPTVVKLADIRLKPECYTQWDLFNLIDQDECVRVMKLFDDPEFWRHLPPVPGAIEGVEGLRRQGYKIHWLTSPWYTCENWEGVRRAWLKDNFGSGPLDITFTSEKFRVDGDILIDDRPKHVKMWQAKHPDKVSWAFDTAYNRFFSWPKRCTWCPEGIKEVL